MDLNGRSQALFKRLMEVYLEKGMPVCSSTLAKMPGVDVSSATVRNVLADLERKGLIQAPHTSSGRVPTDEGYRFFIDSILTYQPLSSHQSDSIKHSLSQDLTQQSLLKNASQLLSGLTGMASLVLLPKKSQEILKQVDFLQIGERRILVVLVFSDLDVQNRIFETSSAVTADQLQKLGNFINSECVGMTMHAAKQHLQMKLNELKMQASDLLDILKNAQQFVVADPAQEPAFFVSGQTNLVNFQEFENSERLRAIYHEFNEHESMLELLDQSMQADGIKVFLGSECGRDAYQGCAMVTRTYRTENEVLGVLGVIGPSRMNYQKVLPEVDMTAEILGSLLKK